MATEKQRNGISSLVFMFLICGAMLQAVSAAAPPLGPCPEADPHEPWYGLPLPSEPRPGYYKFLAKCRDVLKLHCGLEIFYAIFGSGIVDKACCQKMVQMGSECNTELAATFGRFALYTNFAPIITQNSQKIFAQCSKVVGA